MFALGQVQFDFERLPFFGGVGDRHGKQVAVTDPQLHPGRVGRGGVRSRSTDPEGVTAGFLELMPDEEFRDRVGDGPEGAFGAIPAGFEEVGRGGPGGGLGRIDHHGAGGDAFRGVQVSLQMHRGDAEDVADVVEAVADVVGGEILGRVVVDVEEVPDGVVVFGAVEATGGDPAGVEGESGFGAGDGGFDGLIEGGDVLGCGLGGMLFRGHFPGVDLLEDVPPQLDLWEDGGVGADGLEIEVGLGLGAAVAFVAMFFEEGQGHLIELIGLQTEAGQSQGQACHPAPDLALHHFHTQSASRTPDATRYSRRIFRHWILGGP